jgi:hypothetical protein
MWPGSQNRKPLKNPLEEGGMAVMREGDETDED